RGLHGLRPRRWPCSSLDADGRSFHTTQMGHSDRSWDKKMVHGRQGGLQRQRLQVSSVRRSAQAYGAARGRGGGAAGSAGTGCMVRVQTRDVKWMGEGYALDIVTQARGTNSNGHPEGWPSYAIR